MASLTATTHIPVNLLSVISRKEKSMGMIDTAESLSSADAAVSVKQDVQSDQKLSTTQATKMRERIEALATEREVWQDTVLARSNDILYSLIQRCYEVYLDLTSDKLDTKALRMGLKDYCNLKGYSFKDSTPLTAKVVRCVFGDRDRRRLSTYHTVIKVAVANKWAAQDLPAKIAEFGGVQEISLGKATGAITAKEKAKQAEKVVIGKTLASLTGEAVKEVCSTEKIGEQAVAILTQESDGSFTVHAITHSSAAVNAALAAYFSSNKEELKAVAAESNAKEEAASKQQLISKAAESIAG